MLHCRLLFEEKDMLVLSLEGEQNKTIWLFMFMYITHNNQIIKLKHYFILSADKKKVYSIKVCTCIEK